MFTSLFIPLIIILIFLIYVKRSNNDVTIVKSTVDGEDYVVQNKKDKLQAANALANIKIKLKELIGHLKQNKNNDQRVTLLLSRFDPNKISEGAKDRNYTTYTLNKGEKIVFCLRARDNSERLHSLNLLLFVAIHELAHIMTVSTGHTEEFQKNFTYLLHEAVDIGIYKPENFRANPTTYCGISVTDTPLSDEFFTK